MSTFPPAILEHHAGILGKTGSGKTSTAKLWIEQVVAEGHRVCILDPIKSDWWGITLASDGKQPGLGFTILGGPHGHLPLHSSTGKALAEVVASGALPLSIMDMSEFGPGGHAAFFSDFASTLQRKMRGVLYLVLEEAHLFAPKERAGMGRENEAIHWAKMLATAGRSKGIRLVLATQRVQSLHNALLGSCETLIAHRLTLPADQEPVLKWLKANVPDKERMQEIASSLSSLRTGTGWMCSGEAGAFERVQFPPITTYDNTATPKKGKGFAADVRPPPVDQERLRAIIGDAVSDAQTNDPKALQDRVATLERQLSTTKNELQKRYCEVKALQEQLKTAGGTGASEPNDAAMQALAQIARIVSKFSPEQPDKNTTKTIALQPMRTKVPPIRKNWATSDAAGMSPSARKILDTIHRAHPVALSFEAAATRAGISKRSSALSTYRKQVVGSPEVVQREDGRLTSAPGIAPPPGPGIDPIEEYANKLPPSYARMLREIATARHALSRESVATLAGVSTSSSGLAAGLKELVALGLVVSDSDGYSLHPDLRS